MQNLTFEYAESHVKHYKRAKQHLMDQHREALDCYDCEAFLQLGIDAFDWVMRADRVVRSAYADGTVEYSEDVESAVKELCKGWLGPCEYAEEWAQKHLASGYQIDNLVVFRECCRQMQAIVKFNESTGPELLPDTMIRLRDQALEDYRNGKTAEIFSEEEPHDSAIS